MITLQASTSYHAQPNLPCHSKTCSYPFVVSLSSILPFPLSLNLDLKKKKDNNKINTSWSSKAAIADPDRMSPEVLATRRWGQGKKGQTEETPPPPQPKKIKNLAYSAVGIDPISTAVQHAP
jgi:hypothetical protein